jgi:hypothetical protein
VSGREARGAIGRSRVRGGAAPSEVPYAIAAIVMTKPASWIGESD